MSIETEVSNIDSLEHSFEEQAAMQIARLKEIIRTEVDINQGYDNRMIKHIPFDDIRAIERNHFEHNLTQAITTLGNQIFKRKTIKVVDRGNLRNFAFNDLGVIRLKPLDNIKYKTCNAKKANLMLIVLVKIKNLLQDDAYMTARELYYNTATICNCHSSLLKEVINDLCCLLGCSRVHLRILCQPKGIVYGNLKFRLKNNREFDCLSSPEGTIIPTPQSPIVEMTSEAKFVIVIEKDAVLQKMLKQDDLTDFVETYKVILFTAKGYPDINSRAFLKKLYTYLGIPIFVLTDADPHGVEIACCYKFGCFATASEAAFLAIPQIRWLGLLPSDVKNVPHSKTVSLTENDVKKLKSLTKRPFLQNRKDWLEQLRTMIVHNKKAELESIDNIEGYLTRVFLPSKLRLGAWL